MPPRKPHASVRLLVELKRHNSALDVAFAYSQVERLDCQTRVLRTIVVDADLRKTKFLFTSVQKRELLFDARCCTPRLAQFALYAAIMQLDATRSACSRRFRAADCLC